MTQKQTKRQVDRQTVILTLKQTIQTNRYTVPEKKVKRNRIDTLKDSVFDRKGQKGDSLTESL